MVTFATDDRGDLAGHGADGGWRAGHDQRRKLRYKWHRHVRRTGTPRRGRDSWSQTAIVVTEPAGEGTNVPVGVTVAGQTSNVLDFSYDPPSITAISPVTGPTAGGVPVTIDGPRTSVQVAPSRSPDRHSPPRP